MRAGQGRNRTAFADRKNLRACRLYYTDGKPFLL